MDQSGTAPTRVDLARYFLQLGALGFGGPIARPLIDRWESTAV